MRNKAEKGSISALLVEEPVSVSVRERRMSGALLQKVRRNFTVPSDDANFDPPKFAAWAGQPEFWSVYGMSSLFFFVPGIVLVAIAASGVRCATCSCFGVLAELSGSDPIWLSHVAALEGILYLMVGITSVHGDVFCMGTESFWHIADRLVAQMLIVANVANVFALLSADVALGVASVVAAALPLACYSQSYKARAFVPYTAWHILWHFCGAFNRVAMAGVAFAFSETSGFDLYQQRGLYLSFCMFLFLEGLVCMAVWLCCCLDWLGATDEETVRAQHAMKLLQERGDSEKVGQCRTRSPRIASREMCL